MYAQIINRWDAIRDSFWFVPTVMSSGATILALSCTTLDDPIEARFTDFVPWVVVTAEAARASLAAIGGAMVSIASIVFSVMLVTLSITSSQYGSRLLRTFMSDRVTQFALGMLVGTSLFAMLALAGIQESTGDAENANVSVIVGLLLAVVSMAVLITFIHHVANLIQAPNVVAAVAQDLRGSFDRLFPNDLEDQRPPGEHYDVALPEGGSGNCVRSNQEGYLQVVDYDGLLCIAETNDLFMQILVKPGDFIEQNQPIAELWPTAVVGDFELAFNETQAELEGEVAAQINESFVAGPRRTPRQDAECALEELVEVAVRALSPGINDPFTAIACIDRLAAALGRVCHRQMPNPLRLDSDGVPRVLTRIITFPDLMDSAFNQIRQNGGRCVAVAIRLLQAFTRIAAHATSEEQRASIRHHAELVEREFRAHVDQPADGGDFQCRVDELDEALGEKVARP